VIKPCGHMLYPPTTLVQIENTHNRAGGVVVPQAEIEAVCALAREHGIASFLDGARLWNAAEASQLPLDQLAQPFDLVSVALSKGLGAPAGSVLAGGATVIADARRQRRRLGGAMRQAGILAAAGHYAIEHHRAALAGDHENAWQIATQLARSPHLSVALERVQTNIVVFQLRESTDDAATVVRRAAAQGLLVSAFGPRTLRLVTHRDVGAEQCAAAATLLCELLEQRA
jgi:threonine aldolase